RRAERAEAEHVGLVGGTLDAEGAHTVVEVRDDRLRSRRALDDLHAAALSDPAELVGAEQRETGEREAEQDLVLHSRFPPLGRRLRYHRTQGSTAGATSASAATTARRSAPKKPLGFASAST